ncbi:tetratricopeptide repeat protein [Bifidobacterium choloepi]|uniref:Tetratricopeptide repeat protein n=1 Tax=Bifidobacterium choloepi TaxID=2614131 RepID=A0A6I5N0V3_9BIFI|nr:tetratricopeptide repeat protein [Bifidobacterium choloepi]NEG70217.1 tetratricopeptide repeat protein [Bifidobacterium choloepi]
MDHGSDQQDQQRRGGKRPHRTIASVLHRAGAAAETARQVAGGAVEAARQSASHATARLRRPHADTAARGGRSGMSPSASGAAGARGGGTRKAARGSAAESDVRSGTARAKATRPGDVHGGDAAREASDAILALIGADRRIALGATVRRHVLDPMPLVPDGIRLGWAQLPATQGRGFSLGLFPDAGHFVPVAYADDRGRVFSGFEPTMDTHDREPQFAFTKEGDARLPDGPRFGHDHADGTVLDVVQGNIVGRGDDGQMLWLASWLKTGNRYTLEQMRLALPRTMRTDLEFRDAIATAFFATYLVPRVRGLLTGFGSGNIFRRLNREAPLGAIRRAIGDTLTASAHGLRASGLEEHFADLMKEAGALDRVTGLEAVHGREPARLFTSAYSGGYFLRLVEGNGIPFDAVLPLMKIEGNLNRFSAVSSWLEFNGRTGRLPIEDTVTRAEAAQIDQALLANPALLAFTPADDNAYLDLQHGDGFLAVNNLVELARDVARRLASSRPGSSPDATALDGQDAGADMSRTGEWVYRQTLATMLREIRLPYRFDADFRSNLAAGDVAVAVTGAGPALMPDSEYSADRHEWVALDDHRKAAASAAYSLRVGLVAAALAFGAGDDVEHVCLKIDSYGVEEALAEQDSAIKAMIGEAISQFEHLKLSDFEFGGGKADPKDGDYHGDPQWSAQFGHNERHGADDAASDTGVRDDEFEALMRDSGIDEVAFASPEPVTPAEADESSPSGADDAPAADPLTPQPSMTTMVTVEFTRDEFLGRLAADGLAHPIDTYRLFGATMDIDPADGLRPTTPRFALSDGRFAPDGAQTLPEHDDRQLPRPVARILGTDDMFGLSIQRDDLLAHATDTFHRLAADESMPSVEKAQRAMRLVERINDPELTALAPSVTAALIDGTDTPDLEFVDAPGLDDERRRAHDLLFSGQLDRALDTAEHAVADLDRRFASVDGVPRYFNSYAERVVYNRMFATPGEKTVLIPDNLFYAHMELADLLAQVGGDRTPLDHLNATVAYAPAYPLSHLKLASQLARDEDWDSAKAACLNALRVALDSSDAAFAYYRLAQALWMRDDFQVAVAAYVMCTALSPHAVPGAGDELAELVARCKSQCIAVPTSVGDAAHVLARHDIPVWPSRDIADLVRQAARATVDRGMFVPARTLAVASVRLTEGSAEGLDFRHIQFLRSLGE